MRPKPQGKPTFRLVVQMTGEHGYRRIDARKAFWKGLQGHLPASWREAEENASIEFWMSIHGDTAVSGIRLSDRTMRHRTYKFEHFAASLRPTVAAAMARLANFKPMQTIVDPFCGAGTLLAEAWLLELRRILRPGGVLYLTVHDNHTIDVLDGCPDFGLSRALQDAEKLLPFRDSDFAMFTLNRVPGGGIDFEPRQAQVFYDIGYLCQHWGNYLEIVSATQDAYGYQTAIVLRKR